MKIFILGREPLLSAAEVLARYEKKPHDFGEKFLVMDVKKANAEEFGGVVKIADVKEWPSIVESERYGVSTYNINHGWAVKRIKEELEKNGIKAKRVLPKHEPKTELMPSDIIEKKAVDYVFVKGRKRWFGITESVPDIKARKMRDLERDYTKSTSIRIAKILINLSGVKRGQTLLDPFCGTGTIVQEAAIMGINAIGFDIDEGSVEEAREVVEKVTKGFGAKGRWKIEVGDAREIPLKDNSVDAIATEPYLGPLLKANLSIYQAKKIARELIPLYNSFLEEAYRVLKRNGRIAFVMPFFKTDQGIIEMKVDAMEYFVEYNPLRFIGKSMPIEIGKKNRIGRKVHVLKKI